MNIEFNIPYVETRVFGLHPDPEHYLITDEDGEILINIELEGDYYSE